jgi:hypothetical protein
LLFCDGLWSLQLVCFFECFCSVCSIQFSHFIRTTTNAYIIILLHRREGRERERKREKEKGEKLLKTAFPSHHLAKTSSTKQKRDREIERITHKHRRRELCFVPNSARIFKKKR